MRQAEALLRWHHPTRGLVSPAEFVPVAEEIGLIADIGDWVFREATRQLARWRRTDPGFRISVNTSPAQYRNGGIDDAGWLAHLKELGVPADAVTVEITEGLLLETEATIIDQLLRFRDAGIRVSLDDFGTGYSSMSYLSRLDIDTLKIDRSFVRGIAGNAEDRAIAEAMIVMAHKLGIEVVAEGVETREQHDILAGEGCDHAQGFLYARPLPAEAFSMRLAESGFFAGNGG